MKMPEYISSSDSPIVAATKMACNHALLCGKPIIQEDILRNNPDMFKVKKLGPWAELLYQKRKSFV